MCSIRQHNKTQNKSCRQADCFVRMLHICSRTSDRRGRAWITSHVGVGRLGTLAYIIFRWHTIRMFNQLHLYLRNISVCYVYRFNRKLDLSRLYLSTVPDIPCQSGFNNSLDHGDCLRWRTLKQLKVLNKQLFLNLLYKMNKQLAFLIFKS